MFLGIRPLRYEVKERRGLVLRQSGQASIQAIGLLFVTLFAGAFAIDSGVYFSVERGMQNAADAAALAGAAELFRDTSSSMENRLTAARDSAKEISELNMSNALNDGDIEFGYVDPITGDYDAGNFTTPTNDTAFSQTGGYNAVRVTVKAASGEANSAIGTIFTRLFGMESIDSSAQAVAIYGGGIGSGTGLRPVYICQTAWDKAVELYGDATIPEITFYGSTLTVGGSSIDAASSCGALGPGNWGLADLDNGNGAAGAATVRDWFANGSSDPIYLGQWYDAQPGNSIHAYASEISTLINEGAIVQFPLYSETQGNGSNAQYMVSQIASFVITDYKSTGAQSSRYIRGYFKKSICNTSNCSLGDTATGGGITKLRLVN